MSSRGQAMFAVVAIACVACVVGVVWLAGRASHPPVRCSPGLVALGARCCGEGQRVAFGACVGAPSRCGTEHVVTNEGCVPRRARVRLEGGSVRVGPSDWEAQGVLQPRDLSVGTFFLDRFEVDHAQVVDCVRAGRCDASFLGADPPVEGEADAGRAALLTFAQSKSFCASVQGRLPTDDEWSFAAIGKAGRRYPWGETGAVCTRAAFGLVDGPCGRGALGPDTVGARTSGATPEGIQDLAGNAAEWTISSTGAARLRGGSFESSLATELRGWFAAAPRAENSRAGARCAYDQDSSPLRLCERAHDL